jgi:hypothetical protein
VLKHATFELKQSAAMDSIRTILHAVRAAAHDAGRAGHRYRRLSALSGRRVRHRRPIAVLAKAAGLELDDAGFDELLQAWRAIEPALGRLRRNRAFAEEPAHVYDPRQFMPVSLQR